MRIFFINRFYAVLLFSVLLPLLLSGCLKGVFGWRKSVMTPGSDKVTAPTARVDTVRELPDEQPAQEKNITETFPPADEKLPPPLLNPQNPESLMPLSPPAPQPHAGLLPDPATASVRREATAIPPDFSYRDAMLTEDISWHGEVLIEGGVTIAPQATLTVQSGTVVRFKGSAGSGAQGVLVVQGRIIVSGGVDKPVIFTSLYEDAATGDWQGIVLLSSGKKNLIENCRVEGAETGFDASFSTVTMKNTFCSRCRTGVRMQDSIAVMTGGGAGECGSGLILYDCEADIRSADFFDNRLGIYAARTSLALADSRISGNNLLALTADACRLNIAGNSFTANGNGLSLTRCEVSVTANRIAKNAVYGLVLTNSRVKVNGNEIALNARVGLRIDDGKGIAWGNALFDNGDYDLYNAGTEEFRAIGNWWGETTSDIAGRIYDRRMDETLGRVLYLPVLRTRPLTAAP
jgi:hypothetical protein